MHLEIENGDSVATLKGYPFVSVAFSPCSSLIATGIQNGNVLLWNIERKTCILTMHGHSNFVRCVAFDAKGRRLTSASDDKTARVWDIKTGKCLRVFRDHTDWVLGVAFSPGALPSHLLRRTCLSVYGILQAASASRSSESPWDFRAPSHSPRVHSSSSRAFSEATFATGMRKQAQAK